MSQSPQSSLPDAATSENMAPHSEGQSAAAAATPSSEPPPSYVKLAMRNMVRKGGKSLFHFALTSIGLLAALVGLAYLTR